MAGFSRSLLSDNTGPGLPAVIDAVVRENALEGAPYGDDDTTRLLRDRCAEFFGTEVDVYPVATGTGANALAMASIVPSDGVIFCSQLAHMYQSESGAVESATAGARLVPLNQPVAKLDATGLVCEIERLRGKGDASQKPKAVSISQATELGTLYSTEELRSIAAACENHDLALHMDGARLFHALAATGRTPADLTWKVGVDVLSLGITKCGGLFGELVIAFTERLDRHHSRSDDFKRKRRRLGHTLGKMRFVSAQVLALLDEERWRAEAQHANDMAQRLRQLLEIREVTPCVPVQTNQIFCQLSQSVADGLRSVGWSFRDWPAAGTDARRFVTSALTTPATLHALAADLDRLNS